jgi:germination protein YpeB
MRRKKKIVLITSYILAAFAAMGGLALSNYAQAADYKLQLENTYRHAFAELVSSVSELDTALQKSLYATSPELLSAVCTEVYGKALSAQYALSELPFNAYEFENTSGFITKTGDYAFALSKKAGSGEAAGEETYQNLAKLSEAASVLAANLNELMAEIDKSGISLGRMRELSQEAAKAGDEATKDILTDSFTSMEGEFPETPSLIYDGPFSSHIGNLKPKLLEGKNEVTQDEALDIAADFMGISKSILKSDGERGGNLPVYIFYANTDGGTVSIEVTKQGGYVTSAFNSRLVQNALIEPKDAVKIADRFLEKNGYKSMKHSYQLNEKNILVINYAYTKDGVTCYPDLVKVSVALDNGKIVGFESQSYVMNHTERTIPKPAVDEDTARQKVSSHLKVLSHNMAIIPTDGKNEVFCHEFKCENDNGNHYIVYVNAETGGEERILILIESENGTLTI